MFKVMFVHNSEAVPSDNATSVASIDYLFIYHVAFKQYTTSKSISIRIEVTHHLRKSMDPRADRRYLMY